jgi:hypothetical protein
VCRAKAVLMTRNATVVYQEMTVLIPGSFDRPQTLHLRTEILVIDNTYLPGTEDYPRTCLRASTHFKIMHTAEILILLTMLVSTALLKISHAGISSLRPIVSICLPQSYKSSATRISPAIGTL